jgi:hypothetical protein
MNAASEAPRRNASRLVLGGLGLLFGGGLGYLVGRLIKTGVIDASRLGWSDNLAVVIAACLIAMGLIIGLASFSRKAVGRMIDRTGAQLATPAQASFYRQQAVVMFLAGILMAAPVVTTASFEAIPMVVASIIMLAILAIFLIQTVYNLTVWHRSDELIRRVTSETGAVCFWVLQGLLFLWAAAEKLGLAPPLTAWDIMTVLMGTYLVVASIMSARRGLS